MERVIKLLDQYKIINISYEQLWQMDFQTMEPFILKVDWDKVTYEFLIRIKHDADNTIVFGSEQVGFKNSQLVHLFFIDILGWMNLKILLYIIMILLYILENYL